MLYIISNTGEIKRQEMKVRLLKKTVSTAYNFTTKGNTAYSRLQKMSPKHQSKVLNVLDQQTFERQGVENVALPKSHFGLIKLVLKDEWIKYKSYSNSIKEKIENKFNISKPKNTTVQAQTHKKAVKISKNIPEEYKPLFANLEGKVGLEFVNTAYRNMVNYLNLDGIAPKSININGDFLHIKRINGAYNLINNTIEFTRGFIEKLTPQQQMNLIAHELKHCEQLINILRTENIGVGIYSKVIAKNILKRVLDNKVKQEDNSSFEFMIKSQYEQALKEGKRKGKKFLLKTVDNWTKEFITKIETNFSYMLKLSKIKSDSPEGIKALQHLKAMKDYESLDAFGLCTEKYKINPLEIEAYEFAENIEKIFQNFISQQ